MIVVHDTTHQQIAGDVITITDAAASRIYTLINIKGDFNIKFRVYITGGGCSGFQYGFAFEQANEDDVIIIKELSNTNTTIGVIIDPISQHYLEGARLNYLEGLQGSRFVVDNPNAGTSCSCGSSFTIKE